MQISKRPLNPRIKKQIYSLLYQTVADIRSASESRIFLKEALSKTELEMLAKRLSIAYYLDRGRSYSNIKKHLAISSTTIATVAGQIKNGRGLRLALEKIRAEQWADRWAKKISRMMLRPRD